MAQRPVPPHRSGSARGPLHPPRDAYAPAPQPRDGHAYAQAQAYHTRRAQLEKAASLRRQRRTRRIVVGAIIGIVALVATGAICFALLGGSPSPLATAPDGTAFDAPDNAIVAEVDQAPVTADGVVMTLGGDADTYVLKGEDYLEPGCHAYDPQEGNLSTVSASGNVDTSAVGDYVVTYTATLASGAAATAQRTVHVVDSFDALGGNATTLPVLMYHYIYTESAPPAEMNTNYLLDTKFERQLQYLVEHDYYYPSYQEIRAFAQGTHTLPARSVALTFDDGEQGFLKYGTPQLERYQVPGTSFLICTDADTEDKLRTYSNPYVSWQSHSYNMHRAGSSVGRGGIIHALTTAEIVDDLKQAQAILGSTEAFAYPFGDNNENAWAALQEADVLCGFTIENRRIRPKDNPEALPRVRISGDYAQEGFEYLVAPNSGEQ